ncbi:hypothetical protein DYX13_09205, partial [Campylobacter jejuni]|nr:hypothetical protein [Campylobacter jejuni]
MSKILKLIQEYWDFDLITNTSLINEGNCVDLLYQTGNIEYLINNTTCLFQDKSILIKLANTEIERKHINDYEDKYQNIAAIIYLKRKILNNTLEVDESLEIF